MQALMSLDSFFGVRTLPVACYAGSEYGSYPFVALRLAHLGHLGRALAVSILRCSPVVSLMLSTGERYELHQSSNRNK